MKHFFTLASSLILYSCFSSRLIAISLPPPFADSLHPVVSDTVDVWRLQSDMHYNSAKRTEKLSAIMSIAPGTRNFEARIWFNHSLVGHREMIQIVNEGANWFGRIYYFKSGYSMTAARVEGVARSPKSGWGYLFEILMANNLLTLPDDSELPDYRRGTTGPPVV